MQEVFEKIIEMLEEDIIRNNGWEDELHLGGKIAFEHAIEIVKQAAEEYNDGWIPCEVSMPKEHDSIFAKFKGTEKWKDSMFEKASDEVNVTVADKKGNSATMHAHTIDGRWSCDFLRFNKKLRVIAWKPLPDPYQPKGA